MMDWIPTKGEVVRVRESGDLVGVTSAPYLDWHGDWRVTVYHDWGSGRGLYCPAHVGALEPLTAQSEQLGLW